MIISKILDRQNWWRITQLTGIGKTGRRGFGKELIWSVSFEILRCQLCIQVKGYVNNL